MTVTVPWKAPSDINTNGVSDKFDDVRRSLSTGAEHLAEVAAQTSRDAGAQATEVAQQIASDVSKTSWFQQLMRAIGDLAAAITMSGRKTARDASDSAQSLADDLRKVRVTTEPKSTGPDMTPGITLLAGFGAGMALMYFLDPERGQQRRQMLRDRIIDWTNNAQARMNPKPVDDQTELWDSTSEIATPVSPTISPAASSTTGTWPAEDLTGDTPV